MNAAASPLLPDAGDIGLSILRMRRETPQWIVYEGQHGGAAVSAWRYLPHDLRVADDASAEWPRMRDRLATTPPQGADVGILPCTAIYSARSRSGWLIYPVARPGLTGIIRESARLGQLAAGLMLALQHLHRHDTLHLDIHPDNIVETDGRFGLLGIGVDRRRASGARIGSNAGLGRHCYSAPEIWDASARSPLGPWTDIHAAAATLYFAVTGYDPPDFRARIGSPNWRADLSRTIRAKLGTPAQATAMIEALILSGLEPAITARPKTVDEWNRAAMAVAERAATPSPAAATQPASAPKQPFVLPRWLRSTAGLAAGLTAGTVAVWFYAVKMATPFFAWVVHTKWGSGFSESYRPVIAFTAYQCLTLIIHALLRNANAFARNSFMLPAIALFGLATYMHWGETAGWIHWLNAAAVALMLPALNTGDRENLRIATGWSFALLIASIMLAATKIHAGSEILPRLAKLVGVS